MNFEAETDQILVEKEINGSCAMSLEMTKYRGTTGFDVNCDYPD